VKLPCACANTIARTVDLAAQLDDPAPVLRRVADLEAQRAQLMEEAAALRAAAGQRAAAATITEGQVRRLLAQWMEAVRGAGDDELQAQSRQALGDLVERVELDPATMTARVLYALRAGDKVATPRVDQLSPVRWASPPFAVSATRRAA
jgi:hypothetical protein